MKDDRASAIRQHLYSAGHSSIQEIADAVGASPATIRRDLVALEMEGAITRTHGGARIAESAGVEVAFAARESHNLAAKRLIADAAFETIAPHSTVFLDAGTTVLQVARLLITGDHGELRTMPQTNRLQLRQPRVTGDGEDLVTLWMPGQS